MRNLLILPVIQSVLDIRPRYVMIENVPQFTETFITINEGNVKIINLIESKLCDSYDISINLIDTKYYGVPQTRQRAIILINPFTLCLIDYGLIYDILRNISTNHGSIRIYLRIQLSSSRNEFVSHNNIYTNFTQIGFCNTNIRI